MDAYWAVPSGALQAWPRAWRAAFFFLGFSGLVTQETGAAMTLVLRTIGQLEDHILA
jgi:hypothetical protein